MSKLRELDLLDELLNYLHNKFKPVPFQLLLRKLLMRNGGEIVDGQGWRWKIKEKLASCQTPIQEANRSLRELEENFGKIPTALKTPFHYSQNMPQAKRLYILI